MLLNLRISQLYHQFGGFLLNYRFVLVADLFKVIVESGLDSYFVELSQQQALIVQVDLHRKLDWQMSSNTDVALDACLDALDGLPFPRYRLELHQ